MHREFVVKRQLLRDITAMLDNGETVRHCGFVVNYAMNSKCVCTNNFLETHRITNQKYFAQLSFAELTKNNQETTPAAMVVETLKWRMRRTCGKTM